MSQEASGRFMEKAEVFTALVLTGKTSLQESQASEMCGKDWSSHDLPSGKGEHS